VATLDKEDHLLLPPEKALRGGGSGVGRMCAQSQPARGKNEAPFHDVMGSHMLYCVSSVPFPHPLPILVQCCSSEKH
jgi:hypothetical protein